MTLLHNVVYVVFRGSSVIKMYTADTLSQLYDVHVTGMRRPNDIVACCHDRQLYVADCEYCIWRVSVDNPSMYFKWLTTDSTTHMFVVHTLSLSQERLLVTSQRPPALRQYSTTSKDQSLVVQLPSHMNELNHAVETTRDTFVVSHQGTSQDKKQYAVSELFRFCHVLMLLMTS